jgi:K+/H+ antiporter YhaU regulatory subunit KhtT
MIGDIPLRQETGVTIIAVTRAGKTFFDPDPHLPLYPGDRLVLLGEPEGLARAEAFLALSQISEQDVKEEQFSLAEIPLAAESPLVGKSLAEAKFRENYGVSVVGIRRGGWQLAAPSGKEILQAGDSLTVAGKSEVVKQLESQAPL